MGRRMIHGHYVSDEQIQLWVDEAEQGYNCERLDSPRRGRPRIGNSPSVVVPVRFDSDMLDDFLQKAAAQGITSRSQAVREAVRQWTNNNAA